MIKFLKDKWAKFTALFKRKPKQEFERTIDPDKFHKDADAFIKPAVIRPLREVKTVTTVKPRNTVSKLSNTSSGVHPRFIEPYVRRVDVTPSPSDDYLTNYLLIQALTKDDRPSDKVEIVKERPVDRDSEFTYSPTPSRTEEESVRECKPTPIYSSPSKSDVDECYTRSSSSSYDYGSSSSSDSYSSSSSDSGSSWSD